MAKTYAESVKLPNLVSVPHPSTKLLPKSGLNVEGRNNSLVENSFLNLCSKSLDRKAYITSLIETDENTKIKKFGETVHTNSDQVVELINEKLNTGYHGVKHLFTSNDVNKVGRLTKEGFKCVLNQLCGYISNDTWSKILQKFKLNENESISFEEFISYFENNQKVKKELAASSRNIEMVDFNSTSMLSLIGQRDMTKKIPLPELSSTYCFALIKAKTKEKDFDPAKYLPEECFSKNLIMPYHLKNLLDLWKLKLSDTEFQKLWLRFDINNVGCVKTRIFLRLINYKPNHLDELAQSIEVLRTKSCIVEKINPIASSLSNRPKNLTQLSNLNTSKLPRPISNISEEEKENNEQVLDSTQNDEQINETKEEIKNESKEAKKEESKQSTPRELTNSVMINPSDNNLKVPQANVTTFEPPKHEIKYDDDLSDKEDKKDEQKTEIKIELKRDLNHENNKKKTPIPMSKAPTPPVCESTLSESRIKSMVQILKKSNKYGPNQDLIGYLNNRLNEGFILLKTAFEYIDPDHLGCLLLDEFKTVLEEFNIFIDSSIYHDFLKKHGLLKKNKLVDYMKFLQIFQDKGPNSIFKNINQTGLNSTETGSLNKKVENELVNFFHDNYSLVYNYFKESIGEKQTCSVEYFRRLLEQKFAIIVDETQLENLIVFIGQKEESEKNGEIHWNEFFKKYTEIDPWKYFKDSCDKSINSKRQQRLKKNDYTRPTGRIKSLSVPAKEHITENEKDFSDDEEIKLVNSSDEEDNYPFNKYLRLSPRKNANNTVYSEMTKNFKSEDKIIKKLEKKIEILFRLQFHSINKYFSILDPTHTERIDKEKFRLLMHRCGLKFNQTEIDLLWKDFEADVIPFSNFVRRFFKPDEFGNLRVIKHKIRLEKKINENTNKIRASSNDYLSSSAELIENKQRRILKKSNTVFYVIEKVRNSIVFHWNDIKDEFKKEDKNSTTHVPIIKAIEIFKNFKVPLTDDEIYDLCKEFNSNGCDLDYVRLLKYFKASKNSEEASNIKKNGVKGTWNNLNPTLREIIMKQREMHKNNGNDSDINNLRLLFKKFDSSKKGYLTQAEFKKVLAYCQINVSLDDMYMILSEYDPELKGVFCYDIFIRSLIEKLLI